MVAAETSLTAANDLAIRRAFEAVGVEFIDENGGGPVYGCESDNKGTARSPPFLV